MQRINATPPADFPAQVIVMDKELGKRHPTKVFYLRLANENGADHVELDGAITPLDARKLARDSGYEPTHWMMAGDSRPMTF